MDYLQKSLNQVALGNWTDDVTLLGTAGQITLGLFGLDLPSDIRDLAYDLTNWNWTWGHVGQTVLDAIGFVPGVGIVKNADEVSAALKGVFKNSDEVADALKSAGKNSDEISEILRKSLLNEGADIIEGAGDVVKNLKPQNLMDELAQSGVKYTPDDVVTVLKTPDGKLMWLEKGNSSSGLQHIIDGHATDFANKGINDIPRFLNKTLKSTPVNTGKGAAGPYADFLIDGSKYRIVFGTNGYVVSFFPIYK
jgi:hypothetical protein